MVLIRFPKHSGGPVQWGKINTLSAGGNLHDNNFQVLSGQQGSDTYLISRDDDRILLTHDSDTEQDGEVDIVRFLDLALEDLTIGMFDYTQGGTVTHPSGQALDLSWGGGGLLRISNMGSSIERFEFSDGTTLSLIGWNAGGPNIHHLHGTSGDDLIIGAIGQAHVFGNEGNDTLHGSQSSDRLVGGVGNDVYHINHAGDHVVEHSDQGYDHVMSTITHELRWHGQHTEELTLLGTANINGTGNGLNNIIRGNDGHNVINGAYGNDNLFGNGGNDVFRDDAGNDRMTGGHGVDTFVFFGAFGSDVITDFNTALSGERISLAEVTSITSYGDLRANHLSQSGSNAVISDGQGNSITLERVHINDLTADDFLF